MSRRPVWELREAPDVWGRPWGQLRELHECLPASSWTLVGGLMVRLHAHRAGVYDARSTRDVDTVLHLETGAITYASAAGSLGRIGYEFKEPTGPDGLAHRFERGEDEHVDLMVADHLSPSHRPRYRRRPVVAVPAATNVLRYHTVDCSVTCTDGTRLSFSLPDTLGALSLKGGAYINDNRDRRRHLEDGAVLLATVEDPEKLRGQMQGNDARRLRALVRGIEKERVLEDEFPPAQARYAGQVADVLARGRIATIADRFKKPTPVPPEQREGSTTAAGQCGRPTARGTPCRNPASSCPHHT